MTELLEISEQLISTHELTCGLEPLLTDYFGVPRKISKLDRRLYEYRSSFPIEELCVNAGDGSSLRLIFKNLSRAALPDFGRRTKPEFIYDLRRAEQFADSASSAEKQARIKDLAASFQKVVESIMKLPRTFIHGEFYASNVLVQEISEGLRVCPVDWEMAGVGSGIMDLAALTSGTWTEDEKTAIAMAYHSAIPNGIWSTTAEFLTALDYCRL